MAAPGPAQAFDSFVREVHVLESSARTGAPTRDQASRFFGLPHDEFLEELRAIRDEVEQRAYLAIVAATEAVLQVDFRARVDGRATVPLRDEARRKKREERRGRRIVVEDVLDAWADLPGARRAPISEFRQLLAHRHWLAHGRYFPNRAGVPQVPQYAWARARALLEELARLDQTFPRE